MKLVFQLNSNALLLPTYVTYVVVMPLVRRRRGDGSLQVRGLAGLAARCATAAHISLEPAKRPSFRLLSPCPPNLMHFQAKTPNATSHFFFFFFSFVFRSSYLLHTYYAYS